MIRYLAHFANDVMYNGGSRAHNEASSACCLLECVLLKHFVHTLVQWLGDGAQHTIELGRFEVHGCVLLYDGNAHKLYSLIEEGCSRLLLSVDVTYNSRRGGHNHHELELYG